MKKTLAGMGAGATVRNGDWRDTNRRTGDRREREKSRQGVAALLVLICLGVTVLVGSLLLRAAAAQRTYVARLARQAQARWLVEAGIERAVRGLHQSSGDSGETWPIAASELGDSQTAVVHIDIKKDNSRSTERIVRVRVRVRVELLQSGTKTTEVEREVRVAVPRST